MKKFKVAEIVPLAHLADTRYNHYHMCLAHLALENETYRAFYKQMAAIGRFVIMDNGSAEDCQLCELDLIKMYNEVNPSEIVLPDTIGDCNDTLRKTLGFIHAHSNMDYRFMGVPQGKDIEEWFSCARIMANEPRINTIGVSKFLTTLSGDPDVRSKAVDGLVAMFHNSGRWDMEIHLLGCNDKPEDINGISKRYPMVRGCDSAFAFLACRAGVDMQPDMDRPKGAIEFLDKDTYLSNYNSYAEQFELLTGVPDADNGEHYSWM